MEFNTEPRHPLWNCCSLIGDAATAVCGPKGEYGKGPLSADQFPILGTQDICLENRSPVISNIGLL